MKQYNLTSNSIYIFNIFLLVGFLTELCLSMTILCPVAHAWKKYFLNVDFETQIYNLACISFQPF